DVTEIRREGREFREQNNRVLNAMREDLADLRSHVDNGFAEIRGKLDAAEAGQEQIARMLGSLASGTADRTTANSNQRRARVA
ncbi:MAG: hypothetical protein ACRDPY_44510, partial [Streptosporangiaceae bacterium]